MKYYIKNNSLEKSLKMKWINHLSIVDIIREFIMFFLENFNLYIIIKEYDDICQLIILEVY